jgi:hypothetical protein
VQSAPGGASLSALKEGKSKNEQMSTRRPNRRGPAADSPPDTRLNLRYDCNMDDFPITPPIIVKDTPKPRRLTKVAEARDYVGEAMRLGRPAPWREVWHRLKTVASEDEAIEAIGDLRELLVEEDLLLPDGETR